MLYNNEISRQLWYIKMNKKEEENLYSWYNKHKKCDIGESSSEWFENLKKKCKTEAQKNSPCKDELDLNLSDTLKDLSQCDKSFIPQLTTEKNLKCKENSPLSFIDNSCQTDLGDSSHLKSSSIVLNNTAEIALSLGVEPNQTISSFSSSMLTPSLHKTGGPLMNRQSSLKNAGKFRNLQKQVLVRKLFESQSDNREEGILASDSKYPTQTNNQLDRSTQSFNINHDILKEELKVDASFELNISNEINNFHVTSSNINGSLCTSTPISKLNSPKNSSSKLSDTNIEIKQNDLSYSLIDSENQDVNVTLPNTNISYNRALKREVENKDEYEKNTPSSYKTDKNNCQGNLKESPASCLNKVSGVTNPSKETMSKLSVSYLKKKKKFVYPSLTEEINDDKALINPMLVKSISNPIISQQETANEKKLPEEKSTPIPVQKSFKPACTFSDTNVSEKSFDHVANNDNKDNKHTVCTNNLVKGFPGSNPERESSFQKVNKATTSNFVSNSIKFRSETKSIGSPEYSLNDSIKFSSSENTEGNNFPETESTINRVKVWNKVEETNSTLNVEKSYLKNKEEKVPTCNFLGFQSATGNKITISESALKSAKKIWDDVDASHDLTEVKSVFINNAKVSSNCHKPEITKGTLNKCFSKLYSESTFENKPSFSASSMTDSANNSLKFSGFQSAGGRKIQISEKALQSVQKLWIEENKSSEIFEEGIFKNLTESSKVEKTLCTDLSNFNESNAEMKNVHANEQMFHVGNSSQSNNHALKKEMSCIDIKDTSTKSCMKDKMFFESSSEHIFEDKGEFIGFKTASDRKVNINTESLLKARKLWDEALTPENPSKSNKHTQRTETLCTNIKDMSPIPCMESKKNLESDSKNQSQGKKKSIGFRTASDRNVNINTESLLKAKRLWEEVLTSENDSCIDKGRFNDSEVLNFSSELNNQRERSSSPVLGSQKHKNKVSLKRHLSVESLNSFHTVSKFAKEEALVHKSNDSIELKSLSSNRKCTNIPDSIKDSISLHDGSKVYSDLNCNNLNDSLVQFNTSGSINFSKGKKFVDVSNENKISRANTDEKLDIHEITEAFLLDTSWEEFSASPKQKSLLNEERDLKTDMSAVEIERKKLRDNQNKIIHQGKKRDIGQIKLTEGILYQQKLANRGKLFKLSSLLISELTSVSNLFPEVKSHDVADFRFEIENPKQIELRLSDGIKVIPGTDDRVGWKEIETGFLASLNIYGNSIPRHWVQNHYRWIVWKLLSLSRKFGESFVKRPFTLEEVVKQIRYRYDVEVLSGRRSVLRKIFEQDDSPKKTMVLFVAAVNKSSYKADEEMDQPWSSESLFPLVLSDGWYSISAIVDDAMVALINKKVKVGTKLLIHGAEIFGNPSPCHPLNGFDNVQIKIHTNMTRLAPWHSRLGLKSNVGPPPTTLITSVLEKGGLVGTLQLFLSRKYPVVFMERSENKTCIINERVNEFRRRSDELRRETLLQKVYSEVEKEFETKVKVNQKCSPVKLEQISDLSDGRKISELMESSDESLIQILSEAQIELGMKWRLAKLNEKKQRIAKEVEIRLKKIKNKQEVVPMLKLGVIDKKAGKGVITIWKPQEDLISSLVEGKVYKFYYLMATTTRNELMQFSWCKQSFVRLSSQSFENSLPDRIVTPLNTFSTMGTELLVEWGEVDIVAVIVKVMDIKEDNQTVYISDRLSSFVGLKFSPSIQEFGYKDLLQEGAFISVSNCAWKKRCEGVCVVHVTPHTVISAAPDQKHLKESLSKLKENFKENPSILSTMQKKLNEILNERNSMEVYSTESLNSEKATNVKGKIKGLQNFSSPSPLRSLPCIISSPLINRPFRTPVRDPKKSNS